MKTKNLIRILFWLLITTNTFAEVCELPYLPVETRLHNRTFPSVYTEGKELGNRPELSTVEQMALRDAYIGYYHLGVDFRGKKESKLVTFDGTTLEECIARRDELLALNPNMIFLIRHLSQINATIN